MGERKLELNKLNAVFKVNLGKDKFSDICKEYSLTRGKLEWAIKQYSIDYGNNQEIRHQILLGSKLGDGYFQYKNKKYVYRECHSLEEEDYIKWKYVMLGDYVAGNTLGIKNLCTKWSLAKEFCTKTAYSDKIQKYYEMSILEVIENLNMIGLIIYILDDGWYSNHSKNGNILIGSKILSLDEKNLIRDKLSQYGIESKIIGNREDISILSDCNFILYAHVLKLFQKLELDVVQKKFGTIKENYLNYLS